MVDCEEIWKANKLNNKHFEFEKLRTSVFKLEWLCPSGLENLDVRGSWGDNYFDYVRIRLYGCDQGNDCASTKELSNETFNIALLKAIPNLLGEDKQETILYETSKSMFFYTEPKLHQMTNIYLMESSISLEDNIWDLIKSDE